MLSPFIQQHMVDRIYRTHVDFSWEIDTPIKRSCLVWKEEWSEASSSSVHVVSVFVLEPGVLVLIPVAHFLSSWLNTCC